MSSAALPAIPCYRVDKLVVTSSFSQVFHAVHAALGVPVALKVFGIEPGIAAELPYPEAEWRRRFLAEARLLARLDHPHIIRVNDMGFLADGRPWVAMPWCMANLRVEIGRDADPDDAGRLPEGERPRALAPARARQVLAQLCAALAAIHFEGVVHRDVKPTNLLLTQRQGGDVKLCDFGFVKVPGGSHSQGGTWIGTPDYIAPEQRRDASRVSDRADVYSVGVLAYRLLTGRLPAGAFRLPSELVPGLDPWWDGFVRDTMAPSPADRPSAAALAGRLAGAPGR
ncbi:MAG: serine/threonine-protein kinase [Actinomycetota bacterium]